VADIDFSNRNPNDPNGIASIRPSQNRAWVSEDWSTFTLDSSKSKGLREVRYATVTLNDGRQYRAILDSDSKPVSVVGDSTGYDPDQQEAFNRSRPTATSQATAGRQQQSRVMGTNPSTGRPAWVITNYDGTIEYDENVPASTAPRTPGQVADDTRKQQEQVERERNQAAGLGPITDVEKLELDRGKAKDEETKRNRWTEIDRQTKKNEQTGQTEITVTERNELGETRTRNAS